MTPRFGWVPVDGEGVVRCPECDGEYSHIREVFTRLGQDRGEAVVYRGTEGFGTVDARRSALTVVLDGECGHAWEFRIQQHKGINTIEVVTVPGVA